MVPLPISPLFFGPFWLSPSGSDTVGDGTQSNPWRQPQKAADFIRTTKLNEVQAADIIVNLRQGSYAPFALGVQDSGFNGFNVRYMSYDGPGKAVVDAGFQVTNWTNVSGSIFKANVPNTFWTMYENDVRSIMCRTPKRATGSSYPASKAPYFSAGINATNPDTLHQFYTPGDFNPSGWTASDLNIFEWPGDSWDWFADNTPISAIDTIAHKLTLAQEAKFSTYAGNRYFLQGVQQLQSAAGEFYLDRGGGILYYIARDGPIASQNIVIPTAAEAITLTGKSGKDGDRVSHVYFDGVGVQNTDYVQWYRPGWPVPTPGTVDGPVPNPWPIGYIYAWQACMPQNQLGAVRFTHTDNCTFTNGHIRNAGMYGFIANGYGKNHSVLNSWVEKCALASIRMEGQFPGLGDILRDCTFNNLRLNDSGQLSSQGPLQFANSGHHAVGYCEIFNSPRQGIWIVGDNTTDLTYPASQVYTGGTSIDHVLIHDTCQDSADAGALGLDSFANASGRHSQIVTMSQIITYAAKNDPAAAVVNTGAPPVGVFTDDQTWGQVMENVQSYNNDGAQFRINNSGEHTYVNTSYLPDGSPNPSFDVSQMDTANIGTTSSFPYP